MANIKHVGKMKTNGSKVLVVFRTLPGDSNYALVVGTANLSDSYHNSIIQVVESQQAQNMNELGDILSYRYFSDGRMMLEALHQDGKLVKVPTADVLMTPDTSNTLQLSELNALIAEQRGVSIDDLANFIGEKPAGEVQEVAKIKEVPVETKDLDQQVEEDTSNLAPKDLAKKYRSQADSMYKEAAKLRKQADELDPPVKKSVKAKEEAGV